MRGLREVGGGGGWEKGTALGGSKGPGPEGRDRGGRKADGLGPHQSFEGREGVGGGHALPGLVLFDVEENGDVQVDGESLGGRDVVLLVEQLRLGPVPYTHLPLPTTQTVYTLVFLD